MSQILKWKRRRNMTSFQIIIFSFFALIMLGTFLLMLPISSNGHKMTSFADALFTATSATCVTGLIVGHLYAGNDPRVVPALPILQPNDRNNIVSQ